MAAKKPRFFVGCRVRLTAQPNRKEQNGHPINKGAEGVITAMAPHSGRASGPKYGRRVSVLFDGHDARAYGWKYPDVSVPLAFLEPAIGPEGEAFDRFMRRIVQPVGCLDAPPTHVPTRKRVPAPIIVRGQP